MEATLRSYCALCALVYINHILWLFKYHCLPNILLYLSILSLESTVNKIGLGIFSWYFLYKSHFIPNQLSLFAFNLRFLFTRFSFFLAAPWSPAPFSLLLLSLASSFLSLSVIHSLLVQIFSFCLCFFVVHNVLGLCGIIFITIKRNACHRHK